jgi:tetratricopeptide (TPR) repeat protein
MSGEPEATRAKDKALSPVEMASIDEAKSTRRSTVIGAFSAVTSLIAIGAAVAIGLYSAHLTGLQNTNAQQQELVSLVTDIAQGSPASNITNQNTFNPQLTILGEAEEADNLIHELPPSDVSSAEKYIVGLALENGDDYEPALQLLTSAAQEASDPRSASDAWRVAASILYLLQLNSQAERDVNRAIRSYDKPGVTSVSRASNVAFTDLFDVQYRASLDCSVALNEWNVAAQLSQVDPNILSGGNATASEANGRTALISTCRVPADTLKRINIQG